MSPRSSNRTLQTVGVGLIDFVGHLVVAQEAISHYTVPHSTTPPLLPVSVEISAADLNKQK